MDTDKTDNPIKEVLDNLFTLLESMETQNAAVLEFLKDQGLATNEKLAPYFDRAASASSVKWRAARARMAYLLAPAPKKATDQKEAPDAKEPQGKAVEQRDTNQGMPEQVTANQRALNQRVPSQNSRRRERRTQKAPKESQKKQKSSIQRPNQKTPRQKTPRQKKLSRARARRVESQALTLPTPAPNPLRLLHKTIRPIRIMYPMQSMEMTQNRMQSPKPRPPRKAKTISRVIRLPRHPQPSLPNSRAASRSFTSRLLCTHLVVTIRLA